MTHLPTSANLSRRAFLQLGAGLMVAGALAACGGTVATSSTGSGGPSSPSTVSPVANSAGTSAAASPAVATGTAGSVSGGARPSGTAGLKLPTYVPFQGVKPDLPGTADGIDAAFFSFPKTLVKSVTEPAGNGGDVTSATILTQTAPTPMEQNVAWQTINKQLGVTFKATIALATDYKSKLNAIIAGGDLPDIMYGVNTMVSDAPKFFDSQCADLTPYLAGDAVKDYPNLATFPPLSWKGAVFNGKIYGIPIVRPPFGSVNIARKDMFAASGLPSPKNAADLKKLFQAITKPPNQWGLGTLSLINNGSPILSMFGVPNNWRADAGKLTKDWETDEFKAAVAYVRDLWASGVFHPDALTMNTPQVNTAFNGAKFAMYVSSWYAYELKWEGLAPQGNPTTRLDMLDPIPAQDGGKPSYHFGSGAFGMTFLKKGTPDQVKKLLKVMNFFAAPFGTEEWALLTYGVKGTDYNLDDTGNPVLTKQGSAEITDTPFWKYYATNASVLFDSNYPKDWAQTTYAHEQTLIKIGITDPTIGLYSNTYSAQGATANVAFSSALTDILTGRRPMTDYDQLVKDWRSAAGDKARAEFQDALAANQ